MKTIKTMKTNTIYMILLTLVIGLSSCKKQEDADEGRPPILNFKTGSAYVSADATLPMNDTIVIGVTASRAEANDNITKFNVTRSYDGAASTVFYTEDMNVATYDKDLEIITRNVAGSEKFTFTVTNRDGIVTTKSITLTVL